MKHDMAKPGNADWWCSKCDVALVVGKVNVAYLGNKFPVDLLRCPRCGQTFLSEELALVAMAEVEKLLEDK